MEIGKIVEIGTMVNKRETRFEKVDISGNGYNAEQYMPWHGFVWYPWYDRQRQRRQGGRGTISAERRGQ